MSDKARILVVDDERSMREFLEILFRRDGHDVSTAGGVEQATLALDSDDYDLVITDIQMPDGSGLEILRKVRETSPETVVIMITAFATTETAIAAMREGAHDYISKPFQVDEIQVVVEKALEKKLLTRENRRLRTELRGQRRQRTLIGNSRAIQHVLGLIDQVAETKTNVLVTGDSGTGKELVARAIHAESDRASQPFVAVNCGAIPENLLESELFGHVKGAFTGAVQNKEGLFELADGGTLFLDEVGELPHSLQVKLLRVIQEKIMRRVGATVQKTVDVRLIAATNRRLENEVAEGRFREDLYYRLNVIQIPVPPLRERLEDVPLLVHHFIEKYATEFNKPIEGTSEAAMARLLDYHYPGNVRELENIIERAVALTRDNRIDVDAFPPTMARGACKSMQTTVSSSGVQLDTLISDYERTLLREALERAGGVKKRAAKLLGISFRSLRYRFEKLGLDDPGFDDS